MHPTVLTFYVMSAVALIVFVLALYDTFVPNDSHWKWMQAGIVVVWLLFALGIILAGVV